MVDIVERRCSETRELYDPDDPNRRMKLEAGRHYTTTRDVGKDGKVTVFSRYWAGVPVDWFEPTQPT